MPKPKLPRPPTGGPAELTPEEEADQAKLEKEANEAAKAEAKAKKEGKPVKPDAAEGEETPPASDSAPGETETPSEEEDPKPKSLDKGKGKASDEDLAHLSPKAQKRFSKLSKKAKKAESLEKENLYLRQQMKIGAKGAQDPVPDTPSDQPLSPAKPPVSDEGIQLPWGQPTKPAAPKEVSQKEFDGIVDTQATQKAQKLVQQAIKNYDKGQQHLQTLRQDIRDVETEFSELYAGKTELVSDPKSGQLVPKVVKPNPDFDSDLSRSVVSWYRSLSKANPSLRFLTFAREVMSMRAKGAEKAKSQVTQTVAKQAAKQALTPTGTPAGKAGDQSLIGMIHGAETLEDLAKVEKRLPQADR